MFKKILILMLLILPLGAHAEFSGVLSATSTTQGWLRPLRINGIEQTIAALSFIGTSTTATSSFPILSAGLRFLGAGLADCDGANQAVTWDISTWRFGCVTISASGGSSGDPFTHPVGTVNSATTSAIGIGTTTPFSQLAVSTSTQSSPLTKLFTVASTTGSEILSVFGNGNVGIGSSTPWKQLSVGSANVGTFAMSTTTGGCAQFSSKGELFSNAINCITSALASYDAWTHAGGGGQSATTSAIGIGTTTPFSQLSVSTSTASSPLTSLFAVASSTNASLFSILGSGKVQVGTLNLGSFFVSTSTTGCAQFGTNGEIFSRGTACGFGSVTSVATGDGLSGGTITTTGTLTNPFAIATSSGADWAISNLAYITKTGGKTTLGGVGTSTPTCSGLFSCTNLTTLTSQLGATTLSVVYDAWTHAFGGQSATTSAIGIGTTTPFSQLAVSTSTASNPLSKLFTVASSTGAELFSVIGSGKVQVGAANSGSFFVSTSTTGCAQFGTNGELFSRGTACTINGLTSYDAWTHPSTNERSATTSAIGIGTTTPTSQLSVSTSTASSPLTSLFAVASSTNANLFSVLGSGRVTVGTLNVGSFAISSSTAGCVQMSTSGELFSTGSNCGTSAGGGSDPFTHPAGTVNSATTSALGIGTTTPFSQLSVSTSTQSNPLTKLFTVASTTGAEILSVLGNGRVGIGTSTPTKLLEVQGNIAGGIARIRRQTAGIAGTKFGTYSVAFENTGADVDLTGPAQLFEYISSAGVINTIGDIYAQRSGDNTSGILGLTSYSAGVPSQVFTMAGALGVTAVGSSSPSGNGNACGAFGFCIVNAPSTSGSGAANTSEAQLKLVSATSTDEVRSFFTARSNTGSTASFRGEIGAETNHAFGLFTNNLMRASFFKEGGFAVGQTYALTYSSASLADGVMIVQNRLGVGTSSPFSTLSVSTSTASSPLTKLFTVASSTAAELFSVLGNGKVTVGSANTGSFNVSSSTAGCAQFSVTGEIYSVGSNCATGGTPAGTGAELQFRLTGASFGAVANSAAVTSGTGMFVGLGTTTPKWLLQLASSTAPQLALSDGSNTSSHWVWRASGETLTLSTSSPLTFATTTMSDIFKITSAGTAALGVGISGLTRPLGTLHLYEQNGVGNSPSLMLGGNPAGDTDFWMARQTDNSGTDNALDFLNIGRDSTTTGNALLTLDNIGRLGVGSTTPWAQMSIASSTWGQNAIDWGRPLFAVATSSDSFGFLGGIFATTTTLNSSFTTAANSPDSGARVAVGTNSQSGFGGILDQLFVNGRINTGDWSSILCDQTTTISSTITSNTGNVPCQGLYFGEIIDGNYTNTFAFTGQPDQGKLNFNSAVLSNGAMLVGPGNVANLNPSIRTATTSVVIETMVNWDVRTGTSTQIYIGAWSPGFTVNLPTSGCFLTASSTASTGNWYAAALKTGGASSFINTGIGSSTLAAALGDFYKVRIEMSSTICNVYLQKPNGNMQLMASFSGNTIASTTSLMTGIKINGNATDNGTGSSGIFIRRFRVWWKTTFIQ